MRSWRLDRAKADNVPPFFVFTDATLMAIAEARPADAAELLAVSGVGQIKLDNYGAEILHLLASHAGRTH